MKSHQIRCGIHIQTLDFDKEVVKIRENFEELAV